MTVLSDNEDTIVHKIISSHINFTTRSVIVDIYRFKRW